jgi:ABC-type cobalamin/Fe3+-siderophores transport system ATPase subunit
MPKALASNDILVSTLARDLFQNAVHLFTQKKGGVGKSTLAGWLAEYLKSKHGNVVCYDTDPSNQTLARLSALNVRSVNIIKRDEIDAGLFDPMIAAIAEQQGPFVVDTGSSSFHSLWSYIVATDLFGFLHEHGRPVVVHIPLAAKPDLEDTLAGFNDICHHCPPRSVIAWMNERENAIELDGVTFLDLELAQKNREKLLGVVANSKQHYRLHREQVERMLIRHWTFEEAIYELDIRAKCYLFQVRKEIFEQLEQIGI